MPQVWSKNLEAGKTRYEVGFYFKKSKCSDVYGDSQGSLQTSRVQSKLLMKSTG
jgi:hypothetical protein